MKKVTFILGLLGCLYMQPEVLASTGFVSGSGNNQQSVRPGTSVVSPNPARTVATISLFNPDAHTHRVEIFDMIGNRVKTLSPTDKDKIAVDVADLDSGMYFYFIFKGNEKITTGRIIVNH